MTEVADREVDDLRPILAGRRPGPPGTADRLASDAAVRRAWQMVYAAAASRTRDRREAEDAAQEVFCRVLARMDARPGGDAVRRSYLARAATNLLHDQWRRRRYRNLADAAFAGDRPPASVGTEEAVMLRLEAEQLDRALRSLPAVQAQVLRLRIGEGLSSEATAALVGKSPAAVRQIQRRALQALRARLPRPDGGGRR